MKLDINEPEIIAMMRDWGLEGYGFYKIIEKSLSPKKMRVSIRIELLIATATHFGMSEYKAKPIIMDYNLFQVKTNTDGLITVSLKQSKER